MINDLQAIVVLKVSQFIINGLSLFIMIRLFKLKFIKIKLLFEFYIINILVTIAFYFYNNVEMNKLLSIICFVSSSCIFTINAIKIVQLECSSC